MQWKSIYESRLCSLEDAVKHVASGQRGDPRVCLRHARGPHRCDAEARRRAARRRAGGLRVHGQERVRAAAVREGLPPQRVLRRAEHPQGRRRGPGGFLGEQLRLLPAPARRRRPAVRRRDGHRDAAGQGRQLQPGDLGELRLLGGEGREDSHRRGEPAHAVHARQHVPARVGDRPLRLDGAADCHGAAARAQRGRETHRRLLRRAHQGRRLPPAGVRRAAGGRARADGGEARPGHPLRDDLGRRDAARGEGRHHLRPEELQAAEDRDHLRDRIARVLRLDRT